MKKTYENIDVEVIRLTAQDVFLGNSADGVIPDQDDWDAWTGA